VNCIKNMVRKPLGKHPLRILTLMSLLPTNNLVIKLINLYLFIHIYLFIQNLVTIFGLYYDDAKFKCCMLCFV
jgi:hypothetical protein